MRLLFDQPLRTFIEICIFLFLKNLIAYYSKYQKLSEGYHFLVINILRGKWEGGTCVIQTTLKIHLSSRIRNQVHASATWSSPLIEAQADVVEAAKIIGPPQNNNMYQNMIEINLKNNMILWHTLGQPLHVWVVRSVRKLYDFQTSAQYKGNNAGSVAICLIRVILVLHLPIQQENQVCKCFV